MIVLICAGLPDQLASFQHLTSLSLFSALFNGKSTKLHIKIISGPIPVVISRLPLLQELVLKSCKITGQIPDWIGNLSNLRILVLSSNGFQGSMGDVFKSLVFLEQLDLAKNNLSGMKT